MNPNNHSAVLARQSRIPLYPPNRYLILSAENVLKTQHGAPLNKVILSSPGIDEVSMLSYVGT